MQMWEWPRVPASPPKVPKLAEELKSLHADSGPRVCEVGVWRGCCLPLAAGQQDVGKRGIDCEFILIFHWEFIPMDSSRDGSNRISPERLARFSPLKFMASLPLLEMLPACAFLLGSRSVPLFTHNDEVCFLYSFKASLTLSFLDSVSLWAKPGHSLALLLPYSPECWVANTPLTW